MMKLKHNVKPIDLRPEILLAILVAKDVYDEYGSDFVITSLNDSRHSSRSLHYSGNAVDLRVWTLPQGADSGPECAEKIRQRLTKDYDVLFEGDHIHIEYDPKDSD